MTLHEATFRFSTPHARKIFTALSPELSDEVNPRSRIWCRLDEAQVLVMTVEAQDIAALRAALNMFLRLISIADEMQDVVLPETRSGSQNITSGDRE